MALLTRSFKRGHNDVQADQLLADDAIFVIEPKSGDIWPNTVSKCRPIGLWVIYIVYVCT